MRKETDVHRIARGGALVCVIPFDYNLCSVFRAFHRAFVILIDIVASLGGLFLCHLHFCCLWTLPPSRHLAGLFGSSRLIVRSTAFGFDRL